MKKKLALLLVCLLALTPVWGMAAPVRDMESMETLVDQPLQHMLNLVMSAAMLRDVPSLEAGAQIPAEMDEAVFALFNYVESGADSVTLTKEDCISLHDMFFAAGEYIFPKAEDVHCPCITVTQDTMTLDLEELNETPLAGVYVYASSLEEDILSLKADVYTLWGYFSTPAEQVPETDLTWWAGAEILLKADETSPYGYALWGYELTEIYQDGLVSDWQLVENSACEYSVKLPAVLGLADDRAENMVYQTADGAAQVQIACMPSSGRGYQDALNAFRNAHDDFVIEEEADFSRFTAEKEGAYVLCIAHEMLPYVYTLTMEFPPERQQEYTLYGDLIRNSMVVWGMNNG